MTRTLRTLLLSAAAMGALATAAAATPSTRPSPDAGRAGMADMHVSGTMPMHHTEGMAAMHTAMSDEPGAHDAMLDDPAMEAHMAEYGWPPHPGGER